MAHLNQVRLNGDDLIEIVYRGDQTAETVAAVNQTGLVLADRLRRRGAPVLVLANLQYVGNSDVYARRTTATALKKFDYDKIAVFGASKIVEKTAGLVIRAVQKEKKIRLFPSRQAAVSWLFNLAVTTQPAIAVQEEVNAYRRHVKQRIDQLNDIISLATIGEYPAEIEIPEEEDEFTDAFVGLKLLVETLEQKAQRIHSLTLEPKADSLPNKKEVFFQRKLPSPHRW